MLRVPRGRSSPEGAVGSCDTAGSGDTVGTVDTAGPSGAAGPSGTRGASVRRFLGPIAFVAFALVEIAWAVGLPLGAAPDEPAHVYRAVALDRSGDVLPSAAASPSSSLFLDPPYELTVPTVTVNALAPVMCTAWRQGIGYACARQYVAPTQDPTIRTTSTAGRYLWVYYAVVGMPSVIDPDRPGIYAMRVVGGLVGAAMLAAAASTVLRLRRPVLAAVGVAAATTPMVTGMAATVNPSGWEICGGVLVWAASLALLGDGSTERRAWLLAKFALGGAGMLLTRQMSLVWFALILGSVLLGVGPAALRRTVPRLLRDRGAWAAALAVVVAGGYGQFWYLVVDTRGRVPDVQNLALLTRWRQSLTSIPYWTQQGYGFLGWLDAPSPTLAWLVWAAVLGILGLLAVLAAGGPARWAPLATVVAGLLVSVAVEAALRNRLGGSWWQGRYTLPYLAGLPLLCGAKGAAWCWDRRTARALVRWTVVPLALGSTLTFFYVLYRYGAGLKGSWAPSAWAWSPPGSVYPVLLAFGAGNALLCWLLVRAVGEARVPDPGAPAADDQPPALLLRFPGGPEVADGGRSARQ